jgi:hypothetical protein
MKWFRRIALSAGILGIVTLALATHYYYRGFYRPVHRRNASSVRTPSRTTEEYQRIALKVSTQRSFLAHHGFNTRICFLADMQLSSGKNRFFVYDLQNDSILLAGLVAHGCGNKDFSIDPSFSNVDGSNCTSLGKYRIGKPYQGKFGLAYKLYGLDPTNDQAFNRNVVLHAFKAVPEGETAPFPICNSRGCPMLAPAFLQQLQPLIDRSPKPIMLWIFD